MYISVLKLKQYKQTSTTQRMIVLCICISIMMTSQFESVIYLCKMDESDQIRGNFKCRVYLNSCCHHLYYNHRRIITALWRKN